KTVYATRRPHFLVLARRQNRRRRLMSERPFLRDRLSEVCHRDGNVLAICRVAEVSRARQNASPDDKNAACPCLGRGLGSTGAYGQISKRCEKKAGKCPTSWPRRRRKRRGRPPRHGSRRSARRWHAAMRARYPACSSPMAIGGTCSACPGNL